MAQRHRIAASADIAERGDGWRFEVTFQGEKRSAFAVRVDGVVYGYLNSCVHVPVELDWQPGRFFDISKTYLVCATHGAYYRPDNGECIGGPCKGRELTPVELVEEEGSVYWLES